MGQRTKICFVAAELSPAVKIGGLADVAGALPPALHRLGHDVRTFVPLHAQTRLDRRPSHAVDFVRDVPLAFGDGRATKFTLRTTTFEDGGPEVYFVDCPDLFHRKAVYTEDADEALRYFAFCRAVVESVQRMGWSPDVVHCNDWHTALLPLVVRTVYAWDALFHGSRFLLTIHNVGYQGTTHSAFLDEAGLGRYAEKFDRADLAAGRVNFLRTGIVHADAVSTVSPTHADEIRTPEYGMGLDALLRERGVVGILNGVDYDVWSPERDALIPYRYSGEDLDGKLSNKRHLLEATGLDPDPTVPLAGIVSRLVAQKGFDLVHDVLPIELARGNLRLVVLGSGEARHEALFSRLADRFAGRVWYYRGYNEGLAHRIEAGCDLFLMPSRYEPCGSNQMFSMRYGTLPVVRRTGGLADTVEPVDPATGRGTGFVFEHFTPEGLLWALRVALAVYRDRALWSVLVRNAMARDFSWGRQAERYAALYDRI
jgi:starch synthase